MGQQKWLILQLPQGFLQAVASNHLSQRQSQLLEVRFH